MSPALLFNLLLSPRLFFVTQNLALGPPLKDIVPSLASILLSSIAYLKEEKQFCQDGQSSSLNNH